MYVASLSLGVEGLGSRYFVGLLFNVWSKRILGRQEVKHIRWLSRTLVFHLFCV